MFKKQMVTIVIQTKENVISTIEFNKFNKVLINIITCKKRNRNIILTEGPCTVQNHPKYYTTILLA